MVDQQVSYGVSTRGNLPGFRRCPAAAQVATDGMDAYTAHSTREMALRPEAIFRANDWKGDPNKPAERAIYYGKMLQERKLSPADSIQVMLQMATELLNAGETIRVHSLPRGAEGAVRE